MTVSSEQRGGLSRAVSRLRVLFEDDYADVLEGTFGIHVSGRRAGEIEDPDALSLSAHELAARAELVGVVEYLRGEGLDAVEAVERMLREATFTTVNRVLAVRVAEAIGVLPPSLVEGRSSLGFVETLEVFPLLRDADASGGYWSYLQVCGDELSHAVPRLFDRRHPLSVLEPSSDTLDAVVEVLSDPDLDGVWVEPEALGWSYQFFNTQEERKKMRDESQAPRDSRELAVRNQFFTPSYVVDFLVENTLGRRLRESGSELDLPLLLGEIDDDAPPLDLNDVSVLDPAVGSGHFLLGAYDLLEGAWGEQGVSPAEAAPRILGSLFGVDIDPRAAQVAQAVLYLRARRSASVGVLDPPSIVTARPLPKDPRVWGEVLDDAPVLVRDVVEGLGEVLEQAPVLGSLLKPEEYLIEAIGGRLDTPRLGDEELGSFEEVEAMVLEAAGRIAAKAASTPAERMFAADASDALGLVDIMTRRYDTVLMNPPFGAPAEGTKSFIQREYELGWTDLFAAFVERSWALSEKGGAVGAITSSQFTKSRRLHDYRLKLLEDRGLRLLVELGSGVLAGATVDTALTVMCGLGSTRVAYLDITEDEDKGAVLRTRSQSPRLIDSATIRSIPGVPLAFHQSDAVLRLFTGGSFLEPDLALVRSGNNTFDNFRFVRLWWEVPSEERDDGWMPFSKGGEYQPYFSPAHLVVDWRDDGQLLREYGTATGRTAQVMQSSGFWGRPGLAYPVVTSVGFCIRYMSAGWIFSKDTGAVFPSKGVDPGSLLALLNSTAVAQLLEVFGRDRRTEHGALRRLPISSVQLHQFADSTTVDRETVMSSMMTAESLLETSRLFGARSRSVAPGWRQEQMDESIRQVVESLRHSQASIDVAAADVMELSSSDLDQAQSRVELIEKSYALRISIPSEIAAVTLSLLVGGGFGRWDVRVGRDPSLAPALGDPFNPLPVCPPGMLTGDDGLPVVDAPVGYPIDLPPTRVLVDDPGHEWDIVSQMEEVAEFLFSNPDGEIREALSHLKVKDLRSYLRSKFFSQHLKRYSKSRRKAPIYWYLAVPSKEWGVWVYAPWLSREQLFAIARVAQDKMRRLSDEASQLRRDVEAGGDRADRERLEAVEVLLDEVEEFHRIADSVAQSGWEPDLNDGIILNAAPLQELFADRKWRTDIEKHRKKMIDGDYPWAAVQTAYYDRIDS